MDVMHVHYTYASRGIYHILLLSFLHGYVSQTDI